MIDHAQEIRDTLADAVAELNRRGATLFQISIATRYAQEIVDRLLWIHSTLDALGGEEE